MWRRDQVAEPADGESERDELVVPHASTDERNHYNAHSDARREYAEEDRGPTNLELQDVDEEENEHATHRADEQLHHRDRGERVHHASVTCHGACALDHLVHHVFELTPERRTFW